MKLTAIVSMLLISMCGRFNTEKQYRGTPLSGSTYLCSGQDYVAGGFWRDPASGVVTEEAQVDREPTNHWRVMVRGNVASVTSTSGTGDIQTATFAVERTAQGLLLIQADRPPGFSSQIINYRHHQRLVRLQRPAHQSAVEPRDSLFRRVPRYELMRASVRKKDQPPAELADVVQALQNVESAVRDIGSAVDGVQSTVEELKEDVAQIVEATGNISSALMGDIESKLAGNIDSVLWVLWAIAALLTPVAIRACQQLR